MKVTLKSISFNQFKGFKDKTFKFDGKTSVVRGKNASGKTTIANGFFWLLFDKDIDLNSNPNVKPIGVEECQPRVTMVISVDGKDVELCKSQKIKTSKPDENGIVKSSSTNTYLINAVPKSERDYKAYLEELGLPTTDTMLMMSHTDVFTGMKNADMRKILFDMVKDQSDKDIALKLDNISELAALLDNYKLDEVQAMNKATIKRVNEQLVNIPSQIEGLELAKTEDIDVAEFELYIQSINKDIEKKQTEIDEIKAESNKYSTLLSEGMKLDFDRNTELERINKLSLAGKDEIEKKINDASYSLIELKRKINTCDSDISQTQARIDRNNSEFENLKAEYEEIKKAEFDDKNLICPCCGQTYPEDKQANIKAKFFTENKAKMHKINTKAKDIADVTKQLQDDVKIILQVLENKKQELANTENLVADLNNQLDNFKPSEVTDTPELKAIDEKILENKKAVEEIKLHGNDMRLAKANVELADLQNRLADANKVIGANSNNIRIDEQIEQLQEQQIQLEQSKADAEKILYQADLLSKAKNDILADEINSHFNLVKWSLWELQKNGGYKEVCEPETLDGKRLGVSTNTALEMAMKIDICESFQKYYGVELPLFIDGSEAFSTDTYNSIIPNTQHIYLAVTDDDLTVVKGD